MVEILVSAAAGAFVTGVFTVIVWTLNRKAAKEDKQAAKDEKESKALEERLRNIEACMEALIVAERRSYYDRIKTLGKEYLAAGEISTEDLEDFLEMHKIYHGPLEGNGFLDGIVKDVRHLKKI